MKKKMMFMLHDVEKGEMEGAKETKPYTLLQQV